jgi:hypothetical protein
MTGSNCVNEAIAGPSGEPREFDLVFLPVELVGCSGYADASNPPHLSSEVEVVAHDCRRAGDAVFVGVTQLVQGPKKVIPSFVWLERSHDREDFLRDLCGPAAFCAKHTGSIVMEGEMRVFSLSASSDRDGVTSLVQGVPKIHDGVGRDGVQPDWNWLSEAQLCHFLTGFLVEFEAGCVWVRVKECLGVDTEVRSVLLAARE